MKSQPVLFFPHTICKWFSCDYSDAYMPILENIPGEYHMIDKYLNNRTINVINDMNKRFKSTNVKALDLKEGIKITDVRKLKEFIRNKIDLSFFKTIILTHAHTFDSYHNEGKMWTRYQSWLNWSDQGIPVKLTAYEYDFAFIYCLAELCVEYGVTIKSLWFDPLSVKLNYIPGLQMHHYSFHAMTHPWIEKPIQKYIQDSYREITVGVPIVDCRESYAYISAYRRHLETLTWADLNQLNSQKTLQCAFGMSLTWKAPFRERFVHTVIKFNNETDNEKFYMCYKTSRPRHHSIPATSINPPLPYIEYVDKVAEAKTTIMLPSMDVNSFSVIRFIESICYGTIPLIFDNNNYTAGFSYDREIIDVYTKYDLFLKSNASVDEMYAEIKQKSYIVSTKYVEILDAIRKTSFIKKLASPETYKLEALNMLNIQIEQEQRVA